MTYLLSCRSCKGLGSQQLLGPQGMGTAGTQSPQLLSRGCTAPAGSLGSWVGTQLAAGPGSRDT